MWKAWQAKAEALVLKKYISQKALQRSGSCPASHVRLNYGFLLVVMEVHCWQQDTAGALLIFLAADTTWTYDAEDQVSYGPSGEHSRCTETTLPAVCLWREPVVSMTAC